MSKEQRYTLKLIIIGIAVFAVASVPVLIFTKDRFKCEAGLFIGSVMAMLMAWHMSFPYLGQYIWKTPVGIPRMEFCRKTCYSSRHNCFDSLDQIR